VGEADGGRPARGGEALARCGVRALSEPARGCAALDDYYASDIAWLDLKDPKIDLIFAPYETYLDGVLGVKTSYGGRS
jgi:hypothetical protein